MRLITTGAEAKLVEHLTTHKEDLLDGIAVHFNFAQLLEHYRSDYQIKIATNLLTDLLKQQEGGIYLFQDASLVVVGHDVSKTLMEKAIFQLRYLFMDDPLAYTPDGHENELFCDIYYLRDSYDDLAAMARRHMLGNRKPVITANQKPPQNQNIVATNPIKQPSRYFDSSNLAQIERLLHDIDLTPVIRKQPICATVPNMNVRKVFDELYLNIAHLRQLLKTDIDILSNRWLFKYLTLAMDKQMLSLVKAHSTKYLGHPISLNLNVKTLMSDVFAEFDAFLKPSAKVSVVIEIQASDIFEDMYAFISARDSVQKLGYRICLDGLNDKSFAMIDRDVLGVDLVKLQWNANSKADALTKENQMVAEAVKRCGSNRIILTRCDNRQAVDYGQALGISLFQGRYLDELIDPTSQTVN